MCKNVLSAIIHKRKSIEYGDNKKYVIKSSAVVAREGVLGHKCPIFRSMSAGEIEELFNLSEEYDKD